MKMEVQSVCRGLQLPKFKSSNCGFLSHQFVSPSASQFGSRSQSIRFGNAYKFLGNTFPNLKHKIEGYSAWSSKRGAILCASNSGSDTKLGFPSGENSSLPVAIFNGPEPFRGKSGSVSFCGLTHQLVEEGKLMSAPFQEDKGSFLWILAPVVLISSLILPQMFLGNVIEDFIKDNLLMEIVSSLTFESMFYVGLAIFLRITDRVQRPYLQFSPKRWGLITGLRGYLTSAFFTTGLKVVAPLFAVYVTWPVLRLPALVAVLPFLVGCAAQLAFETNLDKRGSSCWPLIPIIFEVYRLYQLSKAANFIERLMFSMKDLPRSPELLERGSAMVSMVVIFQVLGVVCLWSLLTFLLRLFPSRPVAENY
ncbi:hypothetical protein KPL70_016476 [Citrus sinensis]|uniref:Uncharacterized protein n=1 Tax=Citrus clementina TaxID=85681 RepID=V4SKA5_CITCL|nr:uncharacterized protein LOC18040364 isoform X1 [Citrus x clementina]XP_052298317.1 uncharacterized protein LOC102610377 isoform X1 [Citrus sinensis]ESR48138.1 hypothetical protein CICLE_v10001600mg [Citrus x clementina]KAH9692753.1 hypothetical protein KPL70_016476 [Citrus sinensis]